jgi:enoyl-CoA hydratase/carnithine racemase
MAVCSFRRLARGRVLLLRGCSAVIPSAELPETLRAEVVGNVAVPPLARPAKRNALSDPTILGIEQFFQSLDAAVGAVVIAADGDHFCTGPDLGGMAEHER